VPLNVKNTAARISNLFKPGATLSQRVARGGLWVFALRITNRLLRLISTIILARVLAPSDFGLFGIALLTMAALETFSQAGLNAALVQKKRDVSLYLNTAWTFQAIRGGLLAIFLFATAPYVAAFFGTPAAKPVLQVIGISTLILGFNNIGVIYFQKELEFHKQFAYQFSGTLANVCVAVSLVLLLRNVWALVFGLLAGNLAQLVMSYFIHPYRPRLRFDQEQFKELFNFGKWVLGSSILTYLVTQGDNIFVGKLLGAAALGFYQLAYQISNIPATEITHVISQVTFPAYSKLQADFRALRGAYLKVLKLTAFLSFPVAGLIFVCAPDFTRILLGEKWLPMIPAIQALVFYGLLRSLGATTGPIFLALGRPRIVTKLQVVQLFLLFILIYPFTLSGGILGTSLAVVFAGLIPNFFVLYKVSKLINCEIRNLFKAIALPMLSTVLSLFFLNSLRYLMSNLLNFGLTFVFFIMFFLITYYVVGHLFFYKSTVELKSVIKNIL
jgi:O-antigen/teichoic acid export membrane protein